MDKQVSQLKALHNVVLNALNKMQPLNESVDHKTIKMIVNVSSKLLAALEAFSETATPEMKSSIDGELARMISVMENMVSNPASYAPKTNSQKTITLKPVQSDE